MDACWRDDLRPALAARGIQIVRFAELDAAAQSRLQAYFEQAIFPVLTPLVVDPSHPFPFISSGSLSRALNVRNPFTGQDRFARIKVPQNRPRLVDAGEMRFVLLEEVIAADSKIDPAIEPENKIEQLKAKKLLAEIDEKF